MLVRQSGLFLIMLVGLVVLATIEDADDGHGVGLDSERDRHMPPETNCAQAVEMLPAGKRKDGLGESHPASEENRIQEEKYRRRSSAARCRLRASLISNSGVWAKGSGMVA
jgi:hypothetical protein